MTPRTKAAPKKSAKTEEPTEAAVVISAPRIQTIAFEIEGTAPYMGNKFSRRSLEAIMAAQRAGSQSKSRKKREPKDFEECFRQAQHISEEGWWGIPAPAFRNAMIDACRLVGFKMTHAKLSVWAVADGLDKDDGKPLVKLIGGEPEMQIDTVRNETGVVDVRARPMWRKWGAIVRVGFDLDQFSPADVSNLMLRAGMQVGIGEGRPNSKKSFGQGLGTFILKQ